MSFDAAMERLTTALNRNSDLLEKAEVGRAKAIETATALSDKGVTGRPPGSKNKDKPKTETATGGSAGAPAKAPTEEEVRSVFGSYMNVEDKADREKRKQNVIKVLAHFEAKKAGEIDESKRAEAIAAVKDLAAGKTPPIFGSTDSSEEEGEELL